MLLVDRQVQARRTSAPRDYGVFVGFFVVSLGNGVAPMVFVLMADVESIGTVVWLLTPVLAPTSPPLVVVVTLSAGLSLFAHAPAAPIKTSAPSAMTDLCRIRISSACGVMPSHVLAVDGDDRPVGAKDEPTEPRFV